MGQDALPAVDLRVCQAQFPEGLARRSAPFKQQPGAASAASATAPPLPAEAASATAPASKKRPRESCEATSSLGSASVPGPPVTGGAGSGACIVPSGTSLVAYVDFAGVTHTEGLLGSSGRKMGSNPRQAAEKSASLVCKGSLGALFADVWRAARAAVAAVEKQGVSGGASVECAGSEAFPRSYWLAKRDCSTCLPGALLPLHVRAKQAWHAAVAEGEEGGASGGGVGGTARVDFSTWLHGEEKWESFALPGAEGAAAVAES
jgi:hypothetical protein